VAHHTCNVVASIPFYTLNPSPRMHTRWLWTSSRHLSSDSELSCFKKHASLAFFVSGQAQHLQQYPMLDRVCRSPASGAHGLSPCGFSGFCLGSVGSYGQDAGAGGPGGFGGENQPVICAMTSQSTLPPAPKARKPDAPCLRTCLEILNHSSIAGDGDKVRMRV
jgi:hypothetical protein